MDSQTQNIEQGEASASPLPVTPENPETAPLASESGLPGNPLPYTAASWAKNGRDTLQVRLDTYQGRNVIDVRNWYTGTEGDLKPAKGLTISINHLQQLAEGVNAALSYARQHGLVEGGDQ